MKTLCTVVVVAALAGAQSVLAMQEGDASGGENPTMVERSLWSASVFPVIGQGDNARIFGRSFYETRQVVPGSMMPNEPAERKLLRGCAFGTDYAPGDKGPWETARRAFKEQTGYELPVGSAWASVRVKMIELMDPSKVEAPLEKLRRQVQTRKSDANKSVTLPDSFGGYRKDHFLYFARIAGDHPVRGRLRGPNDAPNKRTPVVATFVFEWCKNLSNVHDSVSYPVMRWREEACQKTDRIVNELHRDIGPWGHPLFMEEVLMYLPPYPRLCAIKILQAILRGQEFNAQKFDTKYKKEKDAYYGTAPLDLATCRVRGTLSCIAHLRPGLGVSSLNSIASLPDSVLSEERQKALFDACGVVVSGQSSSTGRGFVDEIFEERGC